MNKLLERFEKERNRERRAFLSMLGKIGVSAPLLKTSPLVAGVFASRFANAQNIGRKKFISIYHPNGTYNGEGKGFVSGPARDVYKGLPGVAMRSANISDPGGHGNLQRAAGRKAWWGDIPENSTIDVQMGRVLQGGAPSAYYAFGVRMDHLGSLSDVISVNSGSPSDVGVGPNGALSKIFSGGAPVNSGGGGGGQTGPSPFDMRQAVLDANRELLRKYKSKFGQDEREKLDSHLGAIESLQTRLDFDEDQASSPPSSGGGGSCSSGESFPKGSSMSPLEEYKAVVDVALIAFNCGLTNAVSIQFNETQATWTPNTPGDRDAVKGMNGDHHGANHGGAQGKIPEIVAYMHKGVAYLIQELQKAGLYDDAAVVVFSEMGQGVDHTKSHGPVVIASGSGVSSGSKATTREHTAAFNDAARILGVDGNIGGALYDYGSGSFL